MSPELPRKQRKSLGKKQLLRHEATGLRFDSEYEFFLHYMWSQKGFKPADHNDVYRDFSPVKKRAGGQPFVQSDNEDGSGKDLAGERHDSAREEEQKLNPGATFYRQNEKDYVQSVPISFNFQVPETLILRDGKAIRWYHSNKLGQIRMRNTKRSLLNLI